MIDFCPADLNGRIYRLFGGTDFHDERQSFRYENA
jgi:hypothetical protein